MQPDGDDKLETVTSELLRVTALNYPQLGSGTVTLKWHPDAHRFHVRVTTNGKSTMFWLRGQVYLTDPAGYITERIQATDEWQRFFRAAVAEGEDIDAV